MTVINFYDIVFIVVLCLFILPMRNGNEIKGTMWEWYENTFYPTYKEWKLLDEPQSIPPEYSFYPTYKEWKRDMLSYT